MKRSVLTVMLVVFSFAFVGAAKPASAEFPDAEFAYMLSNALACSDCDKGTTYPLGFDATLGIPLPLPRFGEAGPLRAVGDVSWARHGKSDTSYGSTFFTGGAGVRYTPPMMPRLGFQALVGIQHTSVGDCSGYSCSSNDLMIQPGLSYRVRPVNARWHVLAGGNFRFVMADGEIAKVLTFTVGIATK